MLSRVGMYNRIIFAISFSDYLLKMVLKYLQSSCNMLNCKLTEHSVIVKSFYQILTLALMFFFPRVRRYLCLRGGNNLLVHL